MDQKKGSLHYLTSQLAEFVAACIHLILYVRQVYPPETFIRCRKFGCLTWWTQSSALEKYIAEIVQSLQDLLQKKIVKKVVLVLLDPGQRLQERFTFEFGNCDWSRIAASLGVATKNEETALHDAFQATLTKLHFTDLIFGLPKKLPIGCTFHLQIETKHAIDLHPQADTADRGALTKEESAAYRRLRCAWLPSSELAFPLETSNSFGFSESSALPKRIVKSLAAPRDSDSCDHSCLLNVWVENPFVLGDDNLANVNEANANDKERKLKTEGKQEVKGEKEAEEGYLDLLDQLLLEDNGAFQKPMET